MAFYQVARGGQSVTLFGSKLIMFGGEDGNRRLLNDVHVLDLETMTWSAVETTYVIYSNHGTLNTYSWKSSYYFVVL